jgi:copper oxidase (laccase) domain-containing protein
MDIDEIYNQEDILFLEGDAPGKWMADLFAIAKIILASQGIKQIHGEPLCTYCEFDRFFSYRRDGETGRFASIIWKE